jgi:hypothetical protein
MANRLVLVGAAFLVFFGVGGLAVATGVVPGASLFLGDEPKQGDPISEDNSSSVVNMSNTDASFSYQIDSVEECGLACRETTVALWNNGTESATGVSVNMSIFTGDELLWEDTYDVGTLEAGDSDTKSQEVQLTYSQGQSIKANEGNITVQAIVRFDQGSDLLTVDYTLSS